MVVVDLGQVYDPEEHEKYLEFLSDNDLQFVKLQDGTYSADISLVKGGGSSVGGGDHSTVSTSQEERRRLQTILKGSRPTQETQRMLAAFHSSSESSDFSCYSKFCQLIDTRTQLDPRERSFKWISSVVSDLYDERSASLPSSETDWSGANNSSDPPELRNFPVFVMDHLSKRYGLRRIVDQVSWDLVFNLHAHRRQNLFLEVFARFLEEYYDSRDLTFYLRGRAAVNSVLQRSVRRGAWGAHKGNVDAQNEFLRWPDVVSVARIIYGPGAGEKHQQFLELVDEHCVQLDESERTTAGELSGTAAVQVSQLLHLAVAQFHDTRVQEATPSTGEFESPHNRQEIMEQVFAQAQEAYKAKLGELGFAEALSSGQIERDLGYQHRVDEMSFALKRSLVRNDKTRDSLSKVNEATIRDWAMRLVGREVKETHKVNEQHGLSWIEKQQDEDGDDNRKSQRRTESLANAKYEQRRQKQVPPDATTSSQRASDKPRIDKQSHSLQQKRNLAVQLSLDSYSPPPPPPPPERSPISASQIPTYAEELGSNLGYSPLARGSAPWKSSALFKPRESRGAISQMTPSRSFDLSEAPQKKPSGGTTEIVMREIQSCLARGKDRYVQSLLANAEQGLPPSVLIEIEKEVRAQLDNKAREILDDVVGSKRDTVENAYLYADVAVPGTCSLASLEDNFKAILRAFNDNDGSFSVMSRKVDHFCHLLLSSSELRQEIEPLVALLVTYASARLGSQAPS